MDWSPPGSPVHGTLQARLLEWAALPFSKSPYVYPQIHSVAAGLKCKGELRGRSGNSGSSGQPWRPGVTTLDFPMGFPRPSPRAGTEWRQASRGVLGYETQADRGPARESVGPGERYKCRALLQTLLRLLRRLWQRIQGRGRPCYARAWGICRSHGQLTLALEHSSGLGARAPFGQAER